MENEKLFTMPFAKVYPLLVAKAERKNRTKQEVDQIIAAVKAAHPYEEPVINAIPLFRTSF